MPRDGRPIAAPASANPDGPDAPWPEDVIRTDETGDVDLSTIAYCNAGRAPAAGGGVRGVHPHHLEGQRHPMVRFREILKALSDQGLGFVVIGDVAASIHGSPVATLDVDVCLDFDEQSVPKILNALRALNPRIRHRPDKMPPPDDPKRLKGVKNST